MSKKFQAVPDSVGATVHPIPNSPEARRVTGVGSPTVTAAATLRGTRVISSRAKGGCPGPPGSSSITFKTSLSVVALEGFRPSFSKGMTTSCQVEGSASRPSGRALSKVVLT